MYMCVRVCVGALVVYNEQNEQTKIHEKGNKDEYFKNDENQRL